MTVFRPVATYQEYPCKAVEYRRSEGLEPEHGSVDISYRHFKKLVVEARAIPWRGVNGFEYPNPITIEAWAKLRAGTTTTPASLKPPAGGGFAHFGNLHLLTVSNDAIFDAMVYRDVYIEDGIEELNEKLAHARKHDRGTVRIQLTDIRQYYREHGFLLSSINVRLPGGGWDPATIKNAATGEPWSALEVIRFLFSQLPGSPIVDSKSELYDESVKLDPPCDIVGEGEPVVQWLAKVLDQAGLVPHMLPDGNYAVQLKVSSRLAYGRIPRGLKDSAEMRHIHAEKKTVWLPKRPAAVVVLGKRRIMRRLVAYVEIFQNPGDGRYYRLQDVDRVFEGGYTLDEVNLQALISPSKNFQDVRPLGKKLGYLRGRALRSDAYRLYAPAAFFEKDKAEFETGVIPSFGSTDAERIEWLPVTDVPVYLSELKTLHLVQGSTRAQGGDQGPFILRAPIVWANTRGEGFFKEFKEVKEAYDALKSGRQDVIRRMEAGRAAALGEISGGGARLRRAHADLSANFRTTKALKAYLAEAGDLIDLDRDEKQALALVGEGPSSGKLIAKFMTDEAIAALVRIARAKRDVDGYQRNIALEQKKLATWDAEFAKYKATYEQYGGIHLRHNRSYEAVQSGLYSFDDRTAILKFSEPACHAWQSFAPLDDQDIVVSGGSVMVLLAYEVKNNSPEDWTMVGFTPDGAPTQLSGVVAQPIRSVVSGGAKPYAIKAKVERAPKMRLYLDEFGNPFNQTEVATEAAGLARGQIRQAIVVEGYTYTLSGFRRAVLDAGVQSVQHVFDGVKASTTVVVNSPNARCPLGPPRLAGGMDGGGRRAVGSVDIRNMIETKAGD